MAQKDTTDIGCGNTVTEKNTDLCSREALRVEASVPYNNIKNECSERKLSNKGYRLTEIQEFYRGTNVLITGGTGFMGKVLIEKLLRSCPHLSNIYLLVRSKKGKDEDARIQELFRDPLFQKLRDEQPSFSEKVLIVKGDCSQPGLGLSPGDKLRILEQVHIVFHAAATVRFDEKLNVAVTTNVVGTQEMLRLCRDCSSIKVVVYVSTAFSHCYRSDINEEFYDLSLAGDMVVKLIESLDENTLTTITPMLLGAWPNTYAYTKAIAEDTVKTLGKGLPVGVFRPSIILSTKCDPLVGWIDNLYGATGALVGVGLGVIRTTHMNSKCVTDMVPCDMAVSALIASAWDIHERRRSGSEDIPIYNYVSSCESPVSWGDYISLNATSSWKIPFNQAVWMTSFNPTKIYSLYRIYSLFLHLLPALMVDIVLFGNGQKLRGMKTYRKVQKFLEVISFFSTRQWNFSNQNVQQLWQKINEDDRHIFNFSISNLNWKQYLNESLMGIRTFLLKEDPKTIPEAIKKKYRHYWLHQCVKFCMICLFLWVCWLTSSVYLRRTGGTVTMGKRFIDNTV